MLNGHLLLLAYYLEILDNINKNIFCRDISVYDIANETASTEYADKTPREYWAIMIDVHY